eukprot:m.32736 g.32736  ORF g.32736 m.32736 type:complete len:902 (+) comp12457_c0_seq1:107-2812(+)
MTQHSPFRSKSQWAVDMEGRRKGAASGTDADTVRRGKRARTQADSFATSIADSKLEQENRLYDAVEAFLEKKHRFRTSAMSAFGLEPNSFKGAFSRLEQIMKGNGTADILRGAMELEGVDEPIVVDPVEPCSPEAGAAAAVVDPPMTPVHARAEGLVGEKLTPGSNFKATVAVARTTSVKKALAAVTDVVVGRGGSAEDMPSPEKVRSGKHKNKAGPVKTPPKRGRRSNLPAWFDEEMTRFVLLEKLVWKTALSKEAIIAHANELIRGTDLESRYKDGLNEAWYYRFMKNSDILEHRKNRNLETARAQWGTSDNILLHYIIAAETAVSCGAAVWNPEFDPYLQEPSEMIHITHPDLIASFDEAGLLLCQDNDSNTGVHQKGTDGQSTTNKGGGRASGVGGSKLSGESLIPGFVTPGNSYDPRWVFREDPLDGDDTEFFMPNSRIFDKGTNRPIPGQVIASGKGGMSTDMGVWAFKMLFLPSLATSPSVGTEFVMPEEPAWRFKTDHPFTRSDSADETLYTDGEAGKMRTRCPMVVCDGHGSHLTSEVLNLLLDPASGMATLGTTMRRCHLVLRPPHTSQITQGEDTAVFKLLKALWRKQKVARVRMNLKSIEVLTDSSWPRYSKGRKNGLDMFDFFRMLKPVWEEAFSVDNCRKGWTQTGWLPFDMRVYWTLKREEDARDAELETTNAKGALTLAAARTMTDSTVFGSATTVTPAPAGPAESESERKKAIKLKHIAALQAAVEGGCEESEKLALKDLKKASTSKTARVPTSTDSWGAGPITNPTFQARVKASDARIAAETADAASKSHTSQVDKATRQAEFSAVGAALMPKLQAIYEADQSSDAITSAFKIPQLKGILTLMSESFTKCKSKSDYVDLVLTYLSEHPNFPSRFLATDQDDAE